MHSVRSTSMDDITRLLEELAQPDQFDWASLIWIPAVAALANAAVAGFAAFATFKSYALAREAARSQALSEITSRKREDEILRRSQEREDAYRAAALEREDGRHVENLRDQEEKRLDERVAALSQLILSWINNMKTWSSDRSGSVLQERRIASHVDPWPEMENVDITIELIHFASKPRHADVISSVEYVIRRIPWSHSGFDALQFAHDLLHIIREWRSGLDSMERTKERLAELEQKMREASTNTIQTRDLR